MAFDKDLFTSGIGSLFGGLFGHSDKPYKDAEEQYNKYYNNAVQNQQPYQDAGTGAIPKYQDWLDAQKDPAKFINDQMGKYNESDYAHNLQQSSLNAGQNAASASGLMGSTPMMQQLQQNAGQITSADQNQWLQHVLGINSHYGAGQKGLIDTGKGAANSLSDLNNTMGGRMGDAEYGRSAGKQNDWFNKIGGAIGTGLSFL